MGKSTIAHYSEQVGPGNFLILPGWVTISHYYSELNEKQGMEENILLEAITGERATMAM